jgi:hypothetical protein
VHFWNIKLLSSDAGCTILSFYVKYWQETVNREKTEGSGGGTAITGNDGNFSWYDNQSLLCTRALFPNRDPIEPDRYHKKAHAFSAASHKIPCSLSHNLFQSYS